MKHFDLCRLLPCSTTTAALVLAGATIAGSAHAQISITAVTSPSLDATQESSLIKQIAEYAEQAQRWQQTLAQYQQMISTVSSLSFQSLLPAQQLQPMDAQQIVQMRCRGSDGFVSNIFTAVTSISLNGKIAENSNRLCAMVETVKVHMYNESVTQANRIPEYDSQMKKLQGLISKLLGSSSSVGDTLQLQLDTTKLQSAFDQEMKAYDTKMKGYQSMLVALEGAQSSLAAVSAKGSPSVIGSVVKATAFASAFSK